MKKLMIASAAVALAGATFAEDVTMARVYDIKAIAMTTVAAKAAVAAEYNPFMVLDNTELVYRQITTKSYSGLIWGCDCDALAAMTEQEDVYTYDEQGKVVGTNQHWEGSVIWDDAKNADNKYRTVFVGPRTGHGGKDPAGKGIWKFVNVVEALGNKVEGCWEINPLASGCKNEVYTNMIVGAGFGYLAGAEDQTDNKTNVCSIATPSYMTGYFAGYVAAPIYTWGEDRTICIYCAGKQTFEKCAAATVWDFCKCVPFVDADKTAFFGQWTISVNAELSNRLLTVEDGLTIFPIANEIKEAVMKERNKAE